MHARHARAFIFLSLLLPLQFVHLARAQQNLPNVTGLVEDPAGKAVVAASVTVENTSGRIVASAHTIGMVASPSLAFPITAMPCISALWPPLHHPAARSGYCGSNSPDR
jgi:hypothetical protein